MRRRFLRLPPRLPLRSHAIALLVAAVAAAAVIALLGRAPMAVEAVRAGAVVAAGTWLYLTVMLQAGARVDNGAVRWRWLGVTWGEVKDTAGRLGADGIPVPDGDDGILGAIAMIILTVVVGMLLLILAWLVANAVALGAGLVAMAVYTVACTGLRAALVHRRRCAGQWGASAAIAAVYAVSAGTLAGLALFGIEAALAALAG
ncbi:MAG: hypothetical protein RLZZ127_124 [Planctomycetota bacterium]|jgi:hypothetical protein